MNDPLSATAIAVPRELDVGHHPGGRMDGLLGAVVCEQRRSAPLGRPRPKHVVALAEHLPWLDVRRRKHVGHVADPRAVS
jgi:hypothetical protein